MRLVVCFDTSARRDEMSELGKRAKHILLKDFVNNLTCVVGQLSGGISREDDSWFGSVTQLGHQAN